MVGIEAEEAGAVVTPTKHADINIFTVASGLLYEVRRVNLPFELESEVDI